MLLTLVLIGKISHIEDLLFIHSFDEYVLDANYMPGCMLVYLIFCTRD